MPSFLTLDGTVKEVPWSNPRTWIYLNVKTVAWCGFVTLQGKAEKEFD